MIRFLAVFCLSLILPATAATPVIVQPYYIADIYGNQITYDIPYRVTVLTLRNFDHDIFPESKRFALRSAYARLEDRPVIMLADQQGLLGTYISVFRDNACMCYTLGSSTLEDDHMPLQKALNALDSNHIYILSDHSVIARRREATVRRLVKDAEIQIRNVSHAVDIRAALVDLNKETRGVLIINAYDIGGDSGGRLRYRAIEKIITEYNTTHLEIGVYRKNHRSALAIGIDPVDIGNAITSILAGTPLPVIKVKSSVNVHRLIELRLTYLATGSFKEALYEPIDHR